MRILKFRVAGINILGFFRLLTLLAVLSLNICAIGRAASVDNGMETDPTRFGAKGDGFSDDTRAVQEALTVCSINGWRCRIPADRKFLVRRPLYIWGNADLVGEGKSGAIIFNVPDGGYLLNTGISGRNRLEKPFAGEISNVAFKVSGGSGGRIIYFWRTIGARIIDNVFDVGIYGYSATSSGNDCAWVASGANCIRKNVTIKGNVINAKAAKEGSEGIGLADFDGAVIENNLIRGVGDDPIGVHYSKNIVITNNDLQSVHGRIYVSNSKNVEIAYNRHERAPSGQDNKYYWGIALIYIGFELFEANDLAAPTNIRIHHNTLIYPYGAIDEGGAIYIYAPRHVMVENNHVVNNSPKVKAAGFRMLPCPFSGRWRDPDGIDPAHVARVWDTIISENSMEGQYPLPMGMTGNCADYKGDVFIRDNAAADFRFYCDKVKLSGNSTIKPASKSALPAQY